MLDGKFPRWIFLTQEAWPRRVQQRGAVSKQCQLNVLAKRRAMVILTAGLADRTAAPRILRLVHSALDLLNAPPRHDLS